MDFASTPELHNGAVCLQALGLAHHDDLVEAVAEGELWRTWFTSTPSPQAMRQEIQRRLSFQVDGQMAPWEPEDWASGRNDHIYAN